MNIKLSLLFLITIYNSCLITLTSVSLTNPCSKNDLLICIIVSCSLTLIVTLIYLNINLERKIEKTVRNVLLIAIPCLSNIISLFYLFDGFTLCYGIEAALTIMYLTQIIVFLIAFIKILFTLDFNE